MRRLLIIVVVLLVIGGIGAAISIPMASYFRELAKPKWRTVGVSRGDIVAVVNSTGTIKPVLSVAVGSFVSGPIAELPCEFNQDVKKGDLLAKVDPRIYKANLERDQATLASRISDRDRTEAQLVQAERDYERALALRKQDASFISQSEMDKYYFSVTTLRAQLEVAKKNVEVSESQVKYSQTQVEYCEILAPIDGKVINRKIDPGQTLAAQFQTPELFVIAPRMREEMHVHASVDEADIGLITQAKLRKYAVHFTVDAYPDELFQGQVTEIRMNSTTTQNVVTYPVIVSATNGDMKLLPGMTANISFRVDERKDVMKIPNAALRFFPNPDHVRPEDKPLVTGESLQTSTPKANDPSNDETTQAVSSATERADRRKNRRNRHVWVKDGEKLRAIPIVTGLTDNKMTEVVSGELTEGLQLVTGLEVKDTKRG